MNQRETKREIRFILDNLCHAREVVREAVKVRGHLVKLTIGGVLPEQDFYKITSLLTPQSRSPLLEKYFIQKHDCQKISKNKNRGDLEKDGKFFEHKVSAFNVDNNLHMVQIRLWQDCDYIIQYITDERAITFVLTHAEMEAETRLCKASFAHGTKEITDANKHNEFRMTIHVGSDNWNRWVKKYATDHPFESF